MEQLKSEQIRVQAEERRKTLSEETRQHQAVRTAGPHSHRVTGVGRCWGTPWSPHSVWVCRPSRLWEDRVQTLKAHGSARAERDGEHMHPKRVCLLIAGRGGGLSEDPGKSGFRCWFQAVHQLFRLSRIHAALSLPRGPSTKTSWPGSATRTS